MAFSGKAFTVLLDVSIKAFTNIPGKNILARFQYDSEDCRRNKKTDDMAVASNPKNDHLIAQISR